MRCAGLIAAAGNSTRMGSCKALLMLNELTFVEHIAFTLKDSGLSPIVVTVPESAHDRTKIEHLLNETGAITVRNKYLQDGFSGSIKTCVDWIILPYQRRLIDAILICPVDMPFVDSLMVIKLIKKASNCCNKKIEFIVAPVLESNPTRLGHPIVVSIGLLQKISEFKNFEGLRGLVAAYKDLVVTVPSIDARILSNINSVGDYRTLVLNNNILQNHVDFV